MVCVTNLSISFNIFLISTEKNLSSIWIRFPLRAMHELRCMKRSLFALSYKGNTLRSETLSWLAEIISIMKINNWKATNQRWFLHPTSWKSQNALDIVSSLLNVNKVLWHLLLHFLYEMRVIAFEVKQKIWHYKFSILTMCYHLSVFSSP